MGQGSQEWCPLRAPILGQGRLSLLRCYRESVRCRQSRKQRRRAESVGSVEESQAQAFKQVSIFRK